MRKLTIIFVVLVVLGGGVWLVFSPKRSPSPEVRRGYAPMASPLSCAKSGGCETPAATEPVPVPVRLEGNRPRSRDPRLRQAQDLFEDGREEAAIELYEQILREEPNHTEALTELGVALSEKEGEVEKSSQLLERAVESSPKNEIAIEEFARLKHRIGGAWAVSEALGKYADKFPESSALAGMYGKSLLETGSAREAVIYLEKAVKDPSIAPGAFFALAEAYRRVGDQRRADEAQAKVVEMQQRFLKSGSDNRP